MNGSENNKSHSLKARTRNIDMNSKLLKQAAQTMRMLSDSVCFQWTGEEMLITLLSQNGQVMAFLNVPSIGATAIACVSTEQLYRVSKGIRKDDTLSLSATETHLVMRVDNIGGSRTYRLPVVEPSLLKKPDLAVLFSHGNCEMNAMCFYRAARDLAATNAHVRLRASQGVLRMDAGDSDELSVCLHGTGTLGDADVLVSSDQLLQIARFASVAPTVCVYTGNGRPIMFVYGSCFFALKSKTHA